MHFPDLFRHEENPLHVKAGNTIIEEGAESNKMYVILEGSVEIWHNGKALMSETEGDIFGELSLVDHELASASVVATSDTKLAAIDEKRFQFLVQQHPYFAISVMQKMSDRIRKMNELA
ncbi:MAG: cyclic nucleotide-binding domain-containing protein [Verrucomicrobiales bacterium]|nr:cyclic nucleotide-binding domain-containing protein [Verrucomicrobiales bacterium]